MKENRSKIVLNEPMGEDAYRLRFEVDWNAYDPGQFVMVSIPGNEVFLRRPFGIAGLSDGVAEICYKVVGKGTCALTDARSGMAIDVTGPCGKGFSKPAKENTAVLVAGGYGIGPMMGMYKVLGEGSVVYYGAKSKDDLLYVDELKSLGAKIVLATEDGSEGISGFITDALANDIDDIASPALYACGPHGMLAAVAKLGLAKGIATEVSMEEYMACGIGVCMGCVCEKAGGGLARTCKDGPVFEAKELKW